MRCLCLIKWKRQYLQSHFDNLTVPLSYAYVMPFYSIVCIHLSFSGFDILMFCAIQYHLYNFKKLKKKPWRSVTFSKVAGFQLATLLKVTLLHGCFSRFLNSANSTKSRNVSHVINYAILSKKDCTEHLLGVIIKAMAFASQPKIRYRRSRLEVFCKKAFLKNCAKFTGIFFLIKLQILILIFFFFF